MNKAEEARMFFEEQFRSLVNDYPVLRNLEPYKLFNILCIKYYFFQADEYSIEDIMDSVVDGANDGSIDAICMDYSEDPTSIAYVQSKYRQSFDVTTALGEIEEIKKNIHKLNDLKYADFNENVVNRYIECINDGANPDSHHIVYFTSFVPQAKQKQKYIKMLEEKGISVFFGDDIKQYISGEIDKTGRVASGSILIDRPDNILSYQESCIVNISAKSLKNLYATYRRALLGLNLRYYVKNKAVDSGIKQTIENHPDHFWYLNNGIVIACDDYDISGREVKLKSFSIINGGQTTDRIFNVDFDEDFYILCKIVKTDMGDDENPDKLTSTSISIATNSQKPIKSKNLVSNRAEQARMKGCLKQLGIFYKTKDGETIDKKYADSNKHVTLDVLGKLGLFAITQRPWCRSNASELYNLDLPYYHTIYEQTTPALYVDLLKLDNYYKAYMKSSVIHSLPNEILARNARTYVLALSVLVSLIMQDPKMFDFLNDNKDDLKSVVGKSIVKEIKSMKKIIVNRIDDESDVIYRLFTEINQLVIYSVFQIEKGINKSLDESNFLKSEDNYYKMIKSMLPSLVEMAYAIRPSAEILFKQKEV